MTSFRTSAVLAAGAMALAGCATVTNPNPADPIEGFNRSMYTFNDKLDKAVMTPVAKGYRFVVPEPARDMVTNFFSNIGDVYNFANNLLQLEVTAAVQDLMRLTINTVFGVGGLVDFASPAGLPKHSQDFGVTLGKWGLPDGPYLVLPLLGPSTVRDTVGLAGNMFIDPTSYIKPDWVSYTIYGVRLVNTRANLLDASNLLEAAALDPYSFTRDAYLARRKYLINGGASGNAALPNYEDEGGAAAAGAGAGAAAAGAGGQPMPAGAPAPASGAKAEPEAPQGSPVPGKMVPGGLPLRR
ncbi:VacJ family lipoprotein [Pandoraea nosoerga]|uniref:ABC transporter n=1 Tax=Pandoraea nosoerga TaxID=2508296 RepID=A0A5E4VMR8_9BURK|nr:VacJ family lipoprotein [Pandoraea nosoerga]MBN4666795.1 VacJ family lipoprotein [Pandoraea nosoerga]MBN4677833.1 VacJ family lipoprotein [Pandoraea nosoerga]MBN4683008.1 VacJ family lipoprotein [Pandoraea nosoerga]MBN4746090.1 VacJ family lipoprotein [Pandoraea nosoerga]VVE13582.1 ABC transporter [Pandoraea nosoerga]